MIESDDESDSTVNFADEFETPVDHQETPKEPSPPAAPKCENETQNGQSCRNEIQKKSESIHHCEECVKALLFLQAPIKPSEFIR